ncbi:MAG: hypothetical protein JW955_21025, partial [Sedimentisphaerales bacterium]|nr:hypothetical protein [Sedimentisphaerales bacterium]
HKGTIICFKSWNLTVLVSWDSWSGGHENVGYCETWPVLPHPWNSCWWMFCSQIKPLVQGVPDFFDGGEPDRSFKPQTLVAGKANQTLEISFKVVNGGTGSPLDGTNVNLYASTDKVITPSDYKLGTTSYFFISNGGELMETQRVIFPTNIPPGYYYIGWIIDPMDLVPDELDEMNNTACVESYRLLVSSSSVPSLELSAARGGRITTPGEGVFAYTGTRTILVSAAADPNCTFAGWEGTAVDAGKVQDPAGASTQVTVDARYSLTALFDGPHMVIEDFEDYNETYPLNAAWVDGLGWRASDPQGHGANGTGSLVGSAEEPTPGNPTIHGGSQAMAFYYDNRKSPYYSEASRQWATLQNWSATGAQDLSIWYRGAATNAAQQMNVAVTDTYRKTATIRHPDYNAVLTREWTQWTIPLQQIQAAGVMLSRVTGLSIGVGEKGYPIGAGVGTLYFDDITLMHGPSLTPGSGSR